VTETLQLDHAVEAIPLHDAPRLIVEWSPRWSGFISSIRPALSRSQARLAGEAPFGLIPLRIVLPAYLLEAFLILLAIFMPAKIAELRPRIVPRFSPHEVIYYSGDELPRTQDFGGAEAGTTGEAGGDESRHRTQTIRIARGESLIPQVVDAPNLKLQPSNDPVANLLTINPDPGPPPAEGLRSTRSALALSPTVIPPSPTVARDYTRNGIQLDSVIAPPPSVTRDQPLTAPSLNATLIPPPPSVTSDRHLIAPALAPTVIPPSPQVARDRNLPAPSLGTSVIAPSPEVSQRTSRSAPTLAANVIPPAPGTVSPESSRSHVQMTDPRVVPPPVSAPERSNARAARLNMPAPAVVAPPPSTDIADTHRAGGSFSSPTATVVPPPPSQPAGGSLISNWIGKIFGNTDVVPPPPSISSRGTGTTQVPSLPSTVVPPPPTVSANTTGGNPRGNRNGMGSSLGRNVVAPPPSVGTVGGTGIGTRGAAPYLGNPSVIPPPPSLPGQGGGTGKTGGGAGAPGGVLLANNIIPPPPSVGGGSGSTGTGLGRKGPGFGSAMDAGSVVAPPNGGGSGNNSGAVISSQPGSKVGLPVEGGPGSLSLSPAGGDKPGLSGSGGGTSIGHGNGSGSGMNGSGSGAAKTGSGRGANADARAGISATNGPGGSGNTASGNPTVRGVDVSGGTSIVTLPGFGDDPAANTPRTSDPHAPGQAPEQKPKEGLNITVVATAGSGGAFEPYRNLLHGENYTTYLETSLGTVVMQFADESTTNHSFGGSLTAPASIQTGLPNGLPHARMVVSCTLDATGSLKNIHVLEAGPAGMTAKVVAALRTWKFRPALRNKQPVEITAILGFGIDTNDRF
jgi:TonB family protein